MNYTRKNQLPNYYIEQSDLYPGQKLKSFLKEHYSQGRSYLTKIDGDFNANGNIETYFYESSINYLVRRLITAAKLMYGVFKAQGDLRIKSEIRVYLEYYSPFQGSELQYVSNILVECCRVSEDDFNSTSKKAVDYQAKRYNWNCYSCGCKFNYDKENMPDSPTHDHNWPRMMGGASEQENIRLMCFKCNSKYKSDYIDTYDYHFEQISLLHNSYSDWESKEKGFNGVYEFAVLAKSEFCCAGCGQPAYKVGDLKMGPIVSSDSWHFFNLTAYCLSCYPKK